MQGIPKQWKGFIPRIVLAYSKVGYVNALLIACALSLTNGFPGGTKNGIVGTLIFWARHSAVICVPIVCQHCLGVEDPAVNKELSF